MMQTNLEVRVVIFRLENKQLQVLLAPKAASWELPDCPHRGGMGLEQAAAEQLMALTGCPQAYVEQLYTYGDANRSGHPDDHTISVIYFGLIPQSGQAPCLSDVKGPQWFPTDKLPNLILDHAEILTYALRRLRYKLEYSAVGFELLPDEFTLSELQRVYEIVLGEKLDKRNFRRRILDSAIIEPTNTKRSGEGRPALLYRYRADAVAEVKARRLFP